MSNKPSAIEPAFDEWFCNNRQLLVEQNLKPAAKILEDIDLLEKVLIKWIDHQVIAESSDFNFNSSQPSLNLHSNLALDSIKKSSFPYDKQLLCWSYKHWFYRLEVLYLNNKTRLDQIKCKIITVDDVDLAYELYFRLASNEDTFDKLSIKYSLGAERYSGGSLPPQPLSSFPKSLRSELISMSAGDLLKPFKRGSSFIIFQMEEWRPSSFDEQAKLQLLQWEYEKWRSSILSGLILLITN